MNNLSDDGIDEGEEDDICEFCGCGPYDSPKCPDCCGHEYNPGTEECDFCPFSDECDENMQARLRGDGKHYV